MHYLQSAARLERDGVNVWPPQLPVSTWRQGHVLPSPASSLAPNTGPACRENATDAATEA